MLASDHAAFPITAEDVRRSRRAYFANISYVDEKIGEILGVLERGGMAENTVVVFVSDHGDMLGERGLWFKMSFREGSARVPLMIAAPGLPPGRRDTPVSTLDVAADARRARRRRPRRVAPDRRREPAPVAAGGGRGPVPMEYAAEGSRRADGRAARRPLQAHALRRRPAAALRPRRRPARDR